jgi:hypothetical protein
MRIFFFVAALCLAISGCALVPPERSIRLQLKDSIDKPYAQEIKARPDLHQKPIGTEVVASGLRIVKHIGEYDEHEGMRIDSYAERKQRWRVVYFLVDAEGTVKDWATVLHWHGKWRCVANNCFKTFKEPPVEKLDEVVRTSSGETIAIWRNGN